MRITSHTGKGNIPKLLGIIPMSGTKQITLRGAAHSKLRKVMSKKNRLREPTRWLRALMCAQGYAQSGDAATGLKSNSLQELILFISSPRTGQNVCFGTCATESFKKLSTSSWNGRMAFTTQETLGRFERLPLGRFVQAVFCFFFNWELWKLKWFYKRIWPTATTSLPPADFTPCHISIKLLRCLPLTNHVYDILEDKMIRLLGALYLSEPA